jgi:hypothetical protein
MLTCKIEIIATRNCIICDRHLIFLMWLLRKLRCTGPEAHFGEQEVHTKVFLENFKHRNNIQIPECAHAHE